MADTASSGDVARRYLDLLKGCLTRELFIDEEVWDVVWWPAGVELGDPETVWHTLHEKSWRLVRPNPSPRLRRTGEDAPPTADTMIGRARLDNVHELARKVLTDRIPGDFVETGVWRGGTVAFMRAVLEAYGDEERVVWACDSFEGLPEPDLDRYPIDAALHLADDKGTTDNIFKDALTVTLDQVRANIDRYGLLDQRIRFLEGWFCDTLPDAPIETISLLRLDGDLYQSTHEALEALEPKLSPGGFVIIDDYHSIEACQQAVADYRDAKLIDAQIHTIDWTGAWWRKPSVA